MPEAGGGFRFRHPVQVRFRDLDPMGHAHHSLVLVYFEEVRAAYWRDVAGRPALAEVDYIMADFRVSYRARILFPQTLEVRARVTRLGTKSWTMAYELRGETGEVLATGESVQVMYDYAAERSIAIPPELRERIERYEQ